jgi:hypothetical protein
MQVYPGYDLNQKTLIAIVTIMLTEGVRTPAKIKRRGQQIRGGL